MLGVFWVTLIFSWYIGLIQWITAAPVEATTLVNGKITYPNVTAAIALTHTLFNTFNTLFFMPFLPLFVRFLEWVVPSKPFKEKPHLTDLDVRMLDTPLLALEQSHKELLKMGDGCRKMMDWLKALIEAADPDKALADRMKRREQILDSIQEEVAHFVTALLSGNIPHAVAREARQQLRIAHEYEAISDYLLNLKKFDMKLREDGFHFTAKQQADLSALHAGIADYLKEIHIAQEQQDNDILPKLDTKRKHLRSLVKKLRQEHLEELSKEAVAPQVSMTFMAALNAYARVRDHSRNIAEAIAGKV
jgi:phosphate:Na+ symporter